MIEDPKTLDEAKSKRYGTWAGDPKGRKYDQTRCAYEVMHGHLFSQCNFRNGKGINNLYCGTHAKKVK